MRSTFAGIVFLSCSFSLWAASGELDVSFGDQGWLTSVLTSKPSEQQMIKMTMLADGSLLSLHAVCESQDCRTAPYSYVYDRFALVKTQADGSPDLQFGVQGRVIHDPASMVLIQPQNFTIFSNGDILVLAHAVDHPQNLFGLFRFDSLGNIRNEFGNGGVVFESTRGLSPSLVISDSQDRIYLSGTLFQGGDDWHYRGFVRRSLADGSVDLSFGDQGYWKVFWKEFRYSMIRDIQVDADEKLVLSATQVRCFAHWDLDRCFKSGNHEIGVYRIESDGQLDSNFGASGLAPLFDVPGKWGTSPKIVFLQDGKISVAAESFGWGGESVSVLKSDGTLDPNFGPDQKGYIVFKGADLGNIFMSSEGKAYTYVLADEYPYKHFLITRYLSDGSIDLSFGQNGVTTYAPVDSVLKNGVLNTHLMAIVPENSDYFYVGLVPYIDGLTSLGSIAKIRK